MSRPSANGEAVVEVLTTIHRRWWTVAGKLELVQEQIAKVLSDLTPREEQVLRKRFGIGEKSDHTLEEVGKLFNVTRERIRQI